MAWKALTILCSAILLFSTGAYLGLREGRKQAGVDAPPAKSARAGAPERPEIEGVTQEDLQAASEYLRDLWRCTAERTLAQVDSVASGNNGETALRYIREELQRDAVAPPPFGEEWTGDEYGVCVPALRTYDFAPWFRRLQLARLIAYVARYYEGNGTMEPAVELIVLLLSGGNDPILQIAAASTLNDDLAFSIREFRWAYGTEGDGGKPHGDVDLSFGDRELVEKAAFPRNAYNCRLPLEEDPALSAKVASMVSGPACWKARLVVLRAVPKMKDPERFADIMIGRFADPSEAPDLREEALSLCKGHEADARVRAAFEGILSLPADKFDSSYWRIVSSLPKLYPKDEPFARALVAAVRKGPSTGDWHDVHVYTLLDYHMQGLGIRDCAEALEEVLNQESSPPTDAWKGLLKRIGENRLRGFEPIIEAIRRSHKDSRIDDCLKALRSAGRK